MYIYIYIYNTCILIYLRVYVYHRGKKRESKTFIVGNQKSPGDFISTLKASREDPLRPWIPLMGGERRGMSWAVGFFYRFILSLGNFSTTIFSPHCWYCRPIPNASTPNSGLRGIPNFITLPFANSPLFRIPYVNSRNLSRENQQANWQDNFLCTYCFSIVNCQTNITNRQPCTILFICQPVRVFEKR